MLIYARVSHSLLHCNRDASPTLPQRSGLLGVVDAEIVCFFNILSLSNLKQVKDCRVLYLVPGTWLGSVYTTEVTLKKF